MNYNLDELFFFVGNSRKYYIRLKKSLEQEFWDYSAILLWKTVVLFLYEKVFQIYQVNNKNNPDFICSVLTNSHSTCENCYSYRGVKDQVLLDNIKKLWKNVDQNHIGNMTSLLNDRNGLSHVNEYEENYNKIWFDAHYTKMIIALRHIQKLHESQILTDFDVTKKIKYLSENDFIFLYASKVIEENILFDFYLDNYERLFVNFGFIVKERLIYLFVTSSSFATAYENGKKLLRISSFAIEDLSNIFIGVFRFQEENKINQVLKANDIDEIFEELFSKTRHLPGAIDLWKKFWEKTGELKYYSEHYDLRTLPELLNLSD